MILRLFGIFALLYPVAGYAVMTSSNYTIYADSVGLNGGSLSTSSVYSLQDTTADSPAGISTSTSYELRGGYQAAERDDLSVSLSSAALDLGTLSDTKVSSASAIVTVTSYSLTGYTLSVGSISGSQLTAVADGEVSAGAEEYGLSASGQHSQVSGDASVIAGRTIASTGAPAYGAATTVVFKASRAPNSASSTYRHTVTFTASANF